MVSSIHEGTGRVNENRKRLRYCQRNPVVYMLHVGASNVRADMAESPPGVRPGFPSDAGSSLTVYMSFHDTFVPQSFQPVNTFLL